MTDYSNTAEGGTNTTQVTTGNSGGFSGTAFTQVFNGASGSITFSSTGAYRGGLCYLFTQPNATTNFLAWDQVSGSSGFQDSVYYYYPAHPDVNHQLVDIRISGGATLGGITISPTGQIRCNAGATSSSFTVGTLTPATWYRLEYQGSGYGGASTALSVQFFVGDSLTPLLTTSVSGATTGSAAQTFRIGKPASSAISNLTGAKIDDWRHSDVGGSGLGPTSPNISASAGVATAQGFAFDAEPVDSGSVSATVEPATAMAFGTAPFETGTSIGVDQLVDALVAVGEAFDATPKVGPGSLVASATGSAFDATIAGTSIVSVSAQVASATGAAFNALVLINGTSPPTVAPAIGEAFDATVSITLAQQNASAILAEALGQAFDATVIADSGVIYFFTTPTFRERWAGRHGLWSRMYLDRGISVLRFGESYQQIDEPSAEQITAADAAYLGGRTYRVSKVEAGRLRDNGYGQWVTEEADPEEHIEV